MTATRARRAMHAPLRRFGTLTAATDLMFSITWGYDLTNNGAVTEAFELWAAGDDTAAGDAFQRFADANAKAVETASGGRTQRLAPADDGFGPVVAGMVAAAWRACSADTNNELVGNGARNTFMYASGVLPWADRAVAMAHVALSEPWVADALHDGCVMAGADMFGLYVGAPLQTLATELINGLTQLELDACRRPACAPSVFAPMPDAVLAISGAHRQAKSRAAGRIVSMVPPEALARARLSWLANMDVYDVARAAWPEMTSAACKTLSALFDDNPDQFLVAARDAAVQVTS